MRPGRHVDRPDFVKQVPVDALQRKRLRQHRYKAGCAEMRQLLEGGPTESIHFGAPPSMAIDIETGAHAVLRLEVPHQHREEPEVLALAIRKEPQLPQLLR